MTEVEVLRAEIKQLNFEKENLRLRLEEAQGLSEESKLDAEIIRLNKVIEAGRGDARRQAREFQDQIVRLNEDIQALTHEGRQGELEQANVGLAEEVECLKREVEMYKQLAEDNRGFHPEHHA